MAAGAEDFGYDALVDEVAALAMPKLPGVSDSVAGRSRHRR